MHPNRRHYTPSVRVQRHITGAAPRNGCSAAAHPLHASPYATVITRKYSWSTSAIIEANLNNDPVPHTAHLTVITVTSVRPRRVIDHRGIGRHTVGSSTHGFRRMEVVNQATAGTNTPFEPLVASLGSVTSRLAGRPPGPALRTPPPRTAGTDLAGPRLDLTLALPAPGQRPAPRPGCPSREPSAPRPRQHPATGQRGGPSTALLPAPPTLPPRSPGAPPHAPDSLCAGR